MCHVRNKQLLVAKIIKWHNKNQSAAAKKTTDLAFTAQK